MKKADVKIGQKYTAKIGGHLTIVKILTPHRNGGWKAEDQFTEKTIRVPTGRQLRVPC